MGYTHYFTFKPLKKGDAKRIETIYKKTLKECTKIAMVYQSTAIGDERLSGYSAYTAAYGGFKINGKDSNAHEDFILREHYKQNLTGWGFVFCKTARKPYDVVVTACLALLKYRLKEYINVTSDGKHVDWVEGVNLANRILKRKIPNPIAKLDVCEECGHSL